MSIRILEPDQFGQIAHFPNLVLPHDADVFAARARRFAQLAPGHAMEQFLLAMGQLAQAQQHAYQARAASLTPAILLEQSRLHAMPPLSWQNASRANDWQVDLDAIISQLAQHGAPALQDAARALAELHSDRREALADAILTGAFEPADAADAASHALLAPVVGAALQVCWTRLAAALTASDIGHVGASPVCPVCASRPVASIVEIGAEQADLRYLHCSLCSSNWHMVRVTCSSCESTKGIAYYSLSGADNTGGPSRKIAFARAEACDACHSYLKIFTREKDPLMEASADDLATLTLDLLVDEAGYYRSGPNLLFAPGAAPPAPEQGSSPEQPAAEVVQPLANPADKAAAKPSGSQ